MSYLVFARKFRPQQFDEIVGQDHIVTTLKNAFLKERIAQSFLFVGSHGIGKTSTARILAKALNCQNKDKLQPYESCDKCSSCKEIIDGSGFDVLEIDGASNRGIDEIRNLRDNVKFKPMHGAYKVYIIDEVHMLTQEAFNALLKTLEEPPPHVKFIFATTESHKIPQTILSRCQRHDFKQVTLDLIVKALRTIAKKEKIEIDDQTLYITAKNAEGSLRDAESLLDKLFNSLSGKITLADAIQILGLTATSIYYELVEKIIARDAESILSILKVEEENGKDLVHFMKGLVEVIRDMLIIKVSKHPERFLHVPKEDEVKLERLVHDISMKEILYFFTVVQNTHRAVKYSPFPKIDIEAALLKLALREDIKELAEILAELDKLKKSGLSGTMVEKPAAVKPVIECKETTTIKKTVSSPSPLPDVEKPTTQQPAKAEHKADIQGSSEEIFNKIRDQWNDIVRSAKDQKMSIGTFLSFGKPVQMKGDRVTIAFSKNNKLNKETLDIEANKRLIETAVASVTDKKVCIEFTINDVLMDENTKPTSEVDQEETDSIIQSALDIFQGRIVEQKERT